MNKNSKLFAMLRLTRPANLVTAVSDILAGIAISGYFVLHPFFEWSMLWLVFATIFLYGGGVVLNDVFDAKLDAVERPERPIPSGKVSISEASIFGYGLLLAGILCSFMVFKTLYAAPFIISIIIAIACISYDKWAKHHPMLGPLNMGICRGLNLLLGMSILPGALAATGLLSAIPVVYVAAITIVSRGEVHGGNRLNLYMAAFLYLVVIVAIGGMGVYTGHYIGAIALLLLFAYMIFKPLLIAIKTPSGKAIGKAVKAGVIALILMNAAWAAAFGAPVITIIILALFPLSLGLAKLFAVT